jgi:hypothetical protein
MQLCERETLENENTYSLLTLFKLRDLLQFLLEKTRLLVFFLRLSKMQPNKKSNSASRDQKPHEHEQEQHR